MTKRIRERLKYVYGTDDVYVPFMALVDKYKNSKIIIDKKKTSQPLTNKDSILITYGDSIKSRGEKPLKTLNRFLSKHVKDSVSGVHILPFSPYSSDYGFSVIDYRKVNPKLGDWSDIRKIGKKYRLMADLVVNHASVKSKWFKGFLSGDDKYKDYFISFDKKVDTSKVFRPRMSPLLTKFKTKKGVKYVWTTFSADQVDLNLKNPDVLLEMVDILLLYLSNSVEIIRLDAVGFVWKELGTSCFHLKKAHELVKLLKDVMKLVAPYSTLVTETNVPYKDNISYFGNNDEADMVYQFSLPPLVIDAFLREDSLKLNKMVGRGKSLHKKNLMFNFLASHDGVGVLGAKDFLSKKDFAGMIQGVKKRKGIISYKSTPKGKAAYEMNISYLDAIGKNKFVASQSIMLSLKGVPGIYIHSLIGTSNYYEGVKKTGVNRSINRRRMNYDSLLKKLSTDGIEKEVFESLINLLKKRRMLLDFDPYKGERILSKDSKLFVLKRGKVITIVNLSNDTVCLKEYSGKKEILTGKKFDGDVKPFKTYWVCS